MRKVPEALTQVKVSRLKRRRRQLLRYFIKPTLLAVLSTAQAARKNGERGPRKVPEALTQVKVSRLKRRRRQLLRGK